jgi:hypothetical protein
MTRKAWCERFLYMAHFGVFVGLPGLCKCILARRRGELRLQLRRAKVLLMRKVAVTA